MPFYYFRPINLERKRSILLYLTHITKRLKEKRKYKNAFTGHSTGLHLRDGDGDGDAVTARVRRCSHGGTPSHPSSHSPTTSPPLFPSLAGPRAGAGRWRPWPPSTASKTTTPFLASPPVLPPWRSKGHIASLLAR